MALNRKRCQISSQRRARNESAPSPERFLAWRSVRGRGHPTSACTLPCKHEIASVTQIARRNAWQGAELRLVDAIRLVTWERLGDLLCLTGIVVDIFADNTQRDFMQIGLQGVIEFGEFRPKDLVEEAPRGTNHESGAPLPMIAIGLESVTSAQRKKKPARPLIGKRNLQFGGRILLAKFGQPCANPFERRLGGQAFAGGPCAGEQGLDLTQFVSQLRFSRHQWPRG